MLYNNNIIEHNHRTHNGILSVFLHLSTLGVMMNSMPVSHDTTAADAAAATAALGHINPLLVASDGPPASWTGAIDAGGLFQGIGVCVYPDGSRYEGGMQNSNRHGMGIFKCIDKTEYTGYWALDMRNGEGTQKSADGSIRKGNKGHWANDKAVDLQVAKKPIPAVVVSPVSVSSTATVVTSTSVSTPPGKANMGGAPPPPPPGTVGVYTSDPTPAPAAASTVALVNPKLQGAGPPASWTGTTDGRGLFQVRKPLSVVNN